MDNKKINYYVKEVYRHHQQIRNDGIIGTLANELFEKSIYELTRSLSLHYNVMVGDTVGSYAVESYEGQIVGNQLFIFCILATGTNRVKLPLIIFTYQNGIVTSDKSVLMFDDPSYQLDCMKNWIAYNLSGL